MIRVIDCEQGSAEWLDARLGMVTASMVGRLIAISPPDALAVDCPVCHAQEGEQCISVARKAPTPIKTAHEVRTLRAAELPPIYGPAKTDTAKSITATLVTERINGWGDPIYVNADMMRGKLDEPLARQVYAEHFAPVTEVGLIVRDDWGFRIGYSPDGLVGDVGLLEIKSRRPKNHLLTILAGESGEVPAENMAQVQAGLLVSGRSWCDYISYAGGMKLWRKRIYPDPDWQGAIVGAVAAFEVTAAEMVAIYTERTAGLPATERIDHFAEIEE